MKTETDVVVVGGGLAGLVAAAFLARAGRRVVVLERASELGGRARTQERDGFHFNEGPHALYRGGPAEHALRELGVKVRGAIPPAAGSLALRGGRLFQLPVGLRTLLLTRLFGFGAKRQVALLLARLPKLDPAPLCRVSVADWLAETLANAEARALAQALVRVTTYAGDARLSAGAAVTQIQMALKNGVLYLDGGWQTMVDAIAAAARTAGARIVTGATVTSIESSASIHSVHLADGSMFSAPALVAAVAPAAARTLFSHDRTIAGWSDTAIPVRAASLDLALSRLPSPRARFALGIDEPFYFSVHSLTAKLAPDGGALIHVARYLGPGESGDRAALEAVADLVQPGWREALVHARYLPAMTVVPWLPVAESGGLAGRPPVAHPTLPGLYFAGDWIGAEGQLADGAFASARCAAQRILERAPLRVAA
jgi:phytoene dehydrogenase-like protein